MPKKVFATHVSQCEHFFHDFFVLLCLKLLEIQRVYLYAAALRWKLGHAPLIFSSSDLKF